MPYTKRQIARINTVNGESLLGDGLPLAAQTAESFIRRRLYAMEDDTVTRLFALWKDTYKAIRAYALDAAADANIGTLSLTPDVVNWRKRVIDYTRERKAQLVQDTAQTVLNDSLRAYTMSYYGRAYVLDMATNDQAQIKIPPISNRQATRHVMQPQFKEAVATDPLIADMFGDTWLDTYSDIGDELVINMRRSLDASTTTGKTVAGSLASLAAVMGVDAAQRGAFSKVNAATRNSVLGAASTGSLDITRPNAVYVLGIMWVAVTTDNRTCKICRGLHGTIWALGDKSMRIPPYDSHGGCRCGPLPVILPDYSKPADEPPDYTWDEWLDTQNELWWVKAEYGSQCKISSDLIG